MSRQTQRNRVKRLFWIEQDKLTRMASNRFQAAKQRALREAARLLRRPSGYEAKGVLFKSLVAHLVAKLHQAELKDRRPTPVLKGGESSRTPWKTPKVQEPLNEVKARLDWWSRQRQHASSEHEKILHDRLAKRNRMKDRLIAAGVVSQPYDEMVGEPGYWSRYHAEKRTRRKKKGRDFVADAEQTPHHWFNLLLAEVLKEVQIHGNKAMTYQEALLVFGEADPNDFLHEDVPPQFEPNWWTHGRIMKRTTTSRTRKPPMMVKAKRKGAHPDFGRQYPVLARVPTYKEQRPPSTIPFSAADLDNPDVVASYQRLVEKGPYAVKGKREFQAEDLLAWFRAADMQGRYPGEIVKESDSLLQKAKAVKKWLKQLRDEQRAGPLDIGGPLGRYALGQIQHDVLTFMQHAYAQQLKQKALTGVTFAVWGKGFTEAAERLYRFSDESHKGADKEMKKLAEEMKSEWVGAMGTKPAYSHYWFYGVVWEPLSQAGQKAQQKMSKAFRVTADNEGGKGWPKWYGSGNNARALVGWRGSNRMFYMMSGALRDAIIVQKEHGDNNTVSYSVRLDPAKMHNKIDSHGRLRGQAVIRRYSGAHRTADYSLHENYREMTVHQEVPKIWAYHKKRQKLVTKRTVHKFQLPMVSKVVGIDPMALTPSGKKKYRTNADFLKANPTGKTLEELLASEWSRWEAQKPSKTRNPMYKGLVRAAGKSKLYVDEKVVDWQEVLYPDDDPEYKAAERLLAKPNPKWGKRKRAEHLENVRAQKRFFRESAASGVGAKVTGRQYRGTIPTLLQKFLWNEYGFSRMKERKASVQGDYGKVGETTQRGAVVMRPLFGPLANDYAKKFYARVLKSTSTVAQQAGFPLEGGMFASFTQGIEGKRSLGPWTGFRYRNESEPYGKLQSQRVPRRSGLIEFTRDGWAANKQRYVNYIRGR